MMLRHRQHRRSVEGTITVIDIDSAWADRRVAGHVVHVLSPAEAAAAPLTDLASQRLVVNLVAPGALDAIAALRARGFTRRFWGCLANPNAPRVLGLGMVEVTEHPADTDRVFRTLFGWAPRDARIVCASADGDAFLRLRHDLSRERLSVSLAWNAQQATDLLAMIHADVAVVDLGLPPSGGHALVTRIAQMSPVPRLLLLPGRTDDALSFRIALRSPRLTHLLRARDEALGVFLCASESPLRAPSKLAAVPGLRLAANA